MSKVDNSRQRNELETWHASVSERLAMVGDCL